MGVVKTVVVLREEGGGGYVEGKGDGVTVWLVSDGGCSLQWWGFGQRERRPREGRGRVGCWLVRVVVTVVEGGKAEGVRGEGETEAEREDGGGEGKRRLWTAVVIGAGGGGPPRAATAAPPFFFFVLIFLCFPYFLFQFCLSFSFDLCN